MKRTFLLSVLISFITISFISSVGCDNQGLSISKKKIKEDYELKERCGKQCQEYFEKMYGKGTITTEIGLQHRYYRNHFNIKLNKCFILEYGFNSTKDGKLLFDYRELRDIHENKIYGKVVRDNNKSTLNCNVADNQCNSVEEWDLLVKPYMEE